MAVASVAALAASVAWLRPGEALTGVVALVVIAWSTLPFAVETLLAPRRDRADSLPERTESMTTIVCVGDEPLDIARTTLILAATVGPTLLVTTSPTTARVGRGLRGVAVFVDPTIDRALARAIDSVETEAVLLTSASAFPTTGSLQLAAALGPRTGWAIGRLESMTPDPFAPEEREAHEAQLRSRVRAGGLVIWEPDATIVRTDLLQRAARECGRPWGNWLRQMVSWGYGGVEHDIVVARRASPTDGPQFWPTEVMRRRGETADLMAVGKLSHFLSHLPEDDAGSIIRIFLCEGLDSFC